MATLRVRGTATVRFDTEVDVEVEELVSESIGDSLAGDLDLDGINIESVEADGGLF